MRYFLTILFLITLNSFFGQEHQEKNNESSIESIKSSYDQLKSKEIDKGNINLLLNRIEYGIILNEEKELKNDLKQLNSFDIDIDTLLLSIDLDNYNIQTLLNAFEFLQNIALENTKKDNSFVFLKANKALIAKKLFYFDLYLEEVTSIVNTLNLEVEKDTTQLALLYADALLKNRDSDSENIEQVEKILLELYKVNKLNTQGFINLLEVYNHQNKTLETINLESELENFNHPKAHYYFSVAYQAQDPNKSKNHLDKYARNFKFDRNSVIWLAIDGESSEIVPPSDLIFIGDSFFEIEQKAACKYYKLASINNQAKVKEAEISELIKSKPTDNRIEYLEIHLSLLEKRKNETQVKIDEKLKGCE